MNYIQQLNAFHDIKTVNPLSSNAQCLYLNLLHINNKCNWITEFTVSNTMLGALTGIDRRTLDRVRNELVQKRYIKYKKGIGNQAGKYLIVQFDTQSDIQNDTQSCTQMTHNVTTLNKLNKTKDIYSRVIDYLNKKVGTNYKSTTDKTKKCITARLNENFTEQDFYKVIDNKCVTWLKDEKMRKYLRPETLFGNKFEGYLNEISESKTDVEQDEGKKLFEALEALSKGEL